MNPVSVIPKPLKITLKSSTFSLTPETTILVTKDTQSIGEYLVQRLTPATGFHFEVKPIGQVIQKHNCIVLQTTPNKKELGKEGYVLSVTSDQIHVLALTPTGIFYGCQTLLQLFPTAIESKECISGVAWTIPQVEIEDQPRFVWRGMHLDVGRHFMPKQFVKKYLDLLAQYKMNIFHWQFTEDQGWRIEIKRYPKLIDIGAWRLENGERYGGYYTQAEIQEVVDYARQRFVTIVPEIEMPGHSVAALAAYPELSCTGGPFTVATTWGIFKDVYCAGNERTFEFLENVLAEVIEMFPGPYIHIGGDECPKTRWQACPQCQARIAREGLKNESELQSYFIKRVEQFLRANNRRLIGWDEILEGGLAPEATVMSWRGVKGGIKAARLGHDTVMSPNSYCYFDHYQSLSKREPKAFGGYLPLRKVYSYEPVPRALTAEQAKHILGAQGNVWTEYMPTPEQVEYMLLPRMCALAEVVWSAQHLRYREDFRARLSAHYPRFEMLGVNYHHPKY